MQSHTLPLSPLTFKRDCLRKNQLINNLLHNCSIMFEKTVDTTLVYVQLLRNGVFSTFSNKPLITLWGHETHHASPCRDWDNCLQKD